jgi:hypothetical protein
VGDLIRKARGTDLPKSAKGADANRPYAPEQTSKQREL